MSFVDNRLPSASVVALVDSVVLGVSKDLLNQKLANDSEFSSRFFRAVCLVLARRLRETLNPDHIKETPSDDHIIQDIVRRIRIGLVK